MQVDLKELSDKEVIERASNRIGSHAQWMAVDELARRAIENENLLTMLYTAIGNDRTIKLRYIPFGSHLAIARILNSDVRHAILRLLVEMNSWTANEQEDAIRAWKGSSNILEGTRQLSDQYGWSPKYMQTA